MRERQPRVALVGWRLGGEIEATIAARAGRVRYVVVSMTLPEEIRPLVEWHRIPELRWNSFRLRWAIFYVLAGLRVARVRADLVHAIGPTPVVPNRVDLNTVTYCHAAYHEATAGERIPGSSVGWRLGERLALALERWWLGRRVRVLVGLSEGSGADLRRLYPRAGVAVVPRGIDLGRFSPDADARREVRDAHGLAPDDVVAVFVDQDHRPLKGLELAIEALALARRLGGGADRLWVLGERNERCRPLAERLGVADRVALLGWTLEPERIYQAADLFVLPSAYESFSRSAHEAAACGLPIVATPVNGVRELIGADEAGMVVPRTAADLARALARLAGDPELRARMGGVARGRAAAFAIDAVAARLAALHDSLLAAPSAGGRDDAAAGVQDP